MAERQPEWSEIPGEKGIVWDKENEVPKNWIQSVDEHVFKALPFGTSIIGISAHRASYWTRTAKIKTEQLDESSLSFFLKVTQGDNGKGMVSGEFVSMKILYKAAPELVPVPICWGTYAADPNVHFFLCRFVEMTGNIPDPERLDSMLADLHVQNISPNSKYGFEVPTYQGTIPQRVGWQDSWETFFSNLMQRILSREVDSQGPNEELISLTEAMIHKAIPRLLRPLETEGREIKSRLVHGDIWDGNTSTDA